MFTLLSLSKILIYIFMFIKLLLFIWEYQEKQEINKFKHFISTADVPTLRKTWYEYRLGDMVKYSKWRNKWNGKLYHIYMFPFSIASTYMLKTSKSDDYTLLQQIINNYDSNITPDPDELVVHLRVGDVIDSNIKSYNYPLEFYREISKKKYNTTSFIYGSHRGELSKKNVDYINSIIDIFIANGHKIKYVGYERTPDNDFVYMCRAKYFCKSGEKGGFTNLISEIVQKNKNITIIN